MDEKPPRNLKAMLSEAKDASELMVDLGYAALFFDHLGMAEEVVDLDERLDELVHDMREICILAARSPHDAEQMSSVLHVIAKIEQIGNAAVDIAHIVTHRLGIPGALVADLAAAEEVSHRVRVRESSDLAGRSLAKCARLQARPNGGHRAPVTIPPSPTSTEPSTSSSR